MRISARRGDPGYELWCCKRVEGIRVQLDGEEIKFCVTADEELGKVIAQRRSADGQPIAINGELQFKTMKGEVHIFIGIPKHVSLP